MFVFSPLETVSHPWLEKPGHFNILLSVDFLLLPSKLFSVVGVQKFDYNVLGMTP